MDGDNVVKDDNSKNSDAGGKNKINVVRSSDSSVRVNTSKYFK